MLDIGIVTEETVKRSEEPVKPDSDVDRLDETGRYHESESLARDEISEFLRKELLDEQKITHAAAIGLFRDLDTKAQGTVAIAGIFLAATFAILRQESIAIPGVKIAIWISVVALMTSVLFAIKALQPREVKTPPSGELLQKMISDISRDSESLAARIPRFYVDRFRVWEQATRTVEESSRQKAFFLKWAHLVLALAVLATGASAVLELIY